MTYEQANELFVYDPETGSYGIGWIEATEPKPAHARDGAGRTATLA